MKKTLTKVTLISSLFLGGLLASSVALAAEPLSQTVTTRGDVQFKAANDLKPVDPVDPEDEKPEPIDPTDPTKPPVVYPGGPLRLNHVPQLSFGVNEIDAKGQVISALLENVIDSESKVETPRASFVEVADETGSLRGWEVTVQSDGIFKSEKGNIEGTMTFNGASLRGLNGMDAKPEAAPTATSSFSIGKDHLGVASVMKADTNKGYNKWQVRYGHSDQAVVDQDKVKRNNKVTLTVPEGQLVLADVEYVAAIQWSLVQGL
ncbi:WxL domain-containing protein [Vagococcus salmoninarum]|uniref:WxL domain-containing protein n=1 Tax=Vagococcus salmoninarum TaxID=2739 RepID=UPI003F98584B